MKNNQITHHAVTGGVEKAGRGRQILDRIFSGMFDHVMIYPQIWEDPEVDLEALNLRKTDEILAIASGGCNLLNMLTESPDQIHGLDLSRAHLALNKLKICAIENFENYEDFFEFFGKANTNKNILNFDKYLLPNLDAESKKYWQARAPFNKRISAFSRNFYRYGALGNFIGFSHILCRLFGMQPQKLLHTKSLDEQRICYNRSLGRLMKHPLLRILTKTPIALFALGIPTAQYHELKGEHKNISEVLEERLSRLACNFDISENYFAWQAFGRRYDTQGRKAIPRYLMEKNFKKLKEQIHKLNIQQKNLTEFLSERSRDSLDAYVLLDAQDWMSNEQLTALWIQINRTSKPNARVIFRTAGKKNILQSRLPAELLNAWSYDWEESYSLYQKDRSAIYGGFHLLKKI